MALNLIAEEIKQISYLVIECSLNPNNFIQFRPNVRHNVGRTITRQNYNSVGRYVSPLYNAYTS